MRIRKFAFALGLTVFQVFAETKPNAASAEINENEVVSDSPVPVAAGEGHAAAAAAKRTEAGVPAAAKDNEQGKKGDPRVHKALRSAGVKYGINNVGNFKVTWDLPEKNGKKRDHMTIVNSETQKLGEFEVREIWAFAYKGPRLPRNLLAKYLIDNGNKKIGAWQLVQDKEKMQETLIFCVTVPADTEGSILRTISSTVAEVADAAEFELDGGDEF